MASGDTKRESFRRGRSYSYGNTYNDQGRGSSKSSLDELLAALGRDGMVYFDGMANRGLFCLAQGMVYRFGLHDWSDRVQAFVTKKFGKDAWTNLTARLAKAREEDNNRIRERDAKWERDNEERRKAQLAQTIAITETENATISKDVELVHGAIMSDFQYALEIKDAHSLPEGDWLDDPVAAYTTGYGFGEEIVTRGGIKLQITVALDMSNSMWHNDIADIAAASFRTIYLALQELQEQYKGNLFAAAFVFAENQDGKRSRRITEQAGRWSIRNVPQELQIFGGMEEFRGKMQSYNAGEDTWVWPLLEAIEKWEKSDTDPGAVRLDLVLTDGVFEHATDVRECSRIQERRDGALQTVFLNFLPERDWNVTKLPYRCVQYKANPDNVAGLLRDVLHEFVSQYV